MTGKVQGGGGIPPPIQSDTTKTPEIKQESTKLGHTITTKPDGTSKMAETSKDPINKFGKDSQEMIQNKQSLDPGTKVTTLGGSQTSSSLFSNLLGKITALFQKIITPFISEQPTVEDQKALFNSIMSKLKTGKETGNLTLTSAEKRALKNELDAKNLNTSRIMGSLDNVQYTGNKNTIYNLGVIIGDALGKPFEEETKKEIKKEQPQVKEQPPIVDVKAPTVKKELNPFLASVLDKLEKGKETGWVVLNSAEETALKKELNAKNLDTGRIMRAIDNIPFTQNKNTIANLEVIIRDALGQTSKEESQKEIKKEQPTVTQAPPSEVNKSQSQNPLFESILEKLASGKEDGKLILTKDELAALRKELDAKKLNTSRIMNAIDSVRYTGNKNQIANLELVISDLLKPT